MQVNGSKRSMHGNNYTDLLQALKGEPLSSVFSSDGPLISASAAPHCGAPVTFLHPKVTLIHNMGLYKFVINKEAGHPTFRSCQQSHHVYESIMLQNKTLYFALSVKSPLPSTHILLSS